MKYIFGIDITENNQNEIADSNIFIDKSTDDELKEKIEKATELSSEADRINKISPFPKRIGSLCGIFAVAWTVVTAISLLMNPENFNQSGTYICFGLIIVCIAICFFCMRYDKKQMTPKEEGKAAIEAANIAFREITTECAKQYGAPENAAEIDVLTFVYTMKNGVPTPYSMFGNPLFMNYIKKVYVKGNSLCLYDLTNHYTLPLDKMGELRIENKKCCLGFWNKTKSFRSPEFSEYGIKPTSYGALSVKSYGVIPFDIDGEEYDLLIPPYEAEAFKKIIGK